MADVVSKGTLFDPELVTDLFSKVKGKSSLIALSQQRAIPFNGSKEFVFSMDDEINLVAENGAKSRGSVALAPITCTPLKVEYGARISDEFLYSAEEAKIDMLKAFNDGFAKKLARGIDIMALHGINPRSKTASALIGTNHFDDGVTAITTGDDANEQVENAVAAVQANDYDASGIIMSPAFRSSLAKLTYTDGTRMFPELAWGSAPASINGLLAQVNNTMSFNSSTDLALIGDFSLFKWGYAKQIPLEIIQYGDPDNSGNDLKGYNQVYIRAEAYIGWAIMDKNGFALVQSAEVSG